MTDTPRLRRITFPRDFRFPRFLEKDFPDKLECFVFQEHEDSLSRDGASLNASGLSEAASEAAETEELDENLLDDDDEDEEDEERSWKRKNNGEEP